MSTAIPGIRVVGASNGSLNVLALNSGSSSLKFGLYRVESSHINVLISGEAASIGAEPGIFSVNNAQQRSLLREEKRFSSQMEVVVRIGNLLTELDMPQPDAIGHRIVHGGPVLRHHCLITEVVLQQFKVAVSFAPLHNPAALTLIQYAQEHFGRLPQVMCIDTAFHTNMPEIASTLPISKILRTEGVQRYGFHGLSYESIVRQLGPDIPHRVIIAHLGNGVSITAIKSGISIDTSMGLTPSGGAIMGTRSGDIDPGVLLYLMGANGFDKEMLEDLVDHRSGLLGISGVSSDMRKLHLAADSDHDANLAIQMFCYSVCKQIASMVAVLEGVDLIVFTGGIGENDPQVRANICERLSWMGIVIDAERNNAVANPVNRSTSRCEIKILNSLEDEQIALHTYSLCPTHRE